MENGLGIVIVHRANPALTKRALKSALLQDVEADVMLVDNFSADGPYRVDGTQVSTLYTLEQWSLSECWNRALSVMWRAGKKACLVVNNDVVLRKDTLRLLVEHGGPFVTCVSVDDEARMGEYCDRDVEQLKATERPHPDFSCWLIHKEVTDKGLWFDEEMFPAYCEDSDFHVKMHRAGVHAVCVDLPFYHYGSGTLKSSDEAEAARIRRGADKNRERFRAKYGCLPGSAEYNGLFR